MNDLARFIEHTLLKPDTAWSEVKQICEEAKAYRFSGICIPPYYVKDAQRFLGEYSRIRIGTVVGFPMGYTAIAAKNEEVKRAAEDGATDIDAVVNLAAVKTGNWNFVENDIESLSRAALLRGSRLKLILECGLLSETEISRICDIAQESRVGWLKTGTGMHGHPATVEMVQLLRRLAPVNMKIKAAGGIRTAAEARALMEAGAELLGCSASVEIVKEV